MGILMSEFEKYSFPDAKMDSGDYFTAAPDAGSEAVVDELDIDLDALDDDVLVDEALDEPLDDGFGDLGKAVHENEGRLFLSVRGLNKFYRQGGRGLHILNNVDLRLYAGEISALVGPSGSGKSTLLHILGLLDTSTSGQVLMGERDVSQISDRERTRLRNEHIGFIYQFHHLLPEFTALENVAMPLVIEGEVMGIAKEKAFALLEQLGLAHRLNHRPATMSGGEQQRVAIARALINDPCLLFADEPTGNLDPETSDEVFELLLGLVRNRGISALIATHNIDLAHKMDRILEVKSGRVLPY